MIGQGYPESRNAQNNLTQRVNAGAQDRPSRRQGVTAGLPFDLSTMSKTEALSIGTKSERGKESLYTAPGDFQPAA